MILHAAFLAFEKSEMIDIARPIPIIANDIAARTLIKNLYISGGPEKIGQILFFIFLYLISIVRSILFHEKMRLQILYNNIYKHLI